LEVMIGKHVTCYMGGLWLWPIPGLSACGHLIYPGDDVSVKRQVFGLVILP